MRGTLCLLILASALGAQPRPAQLDASQIEFGLRTAVRLADRDTAYSITERMRLWHTPGVSIAVIDNWRVVWTKGFGVREFGSRVPVDTNTVFLAGSISKPVFVSGLLSLVEQGKIGLDADINTALKSWHLPESRFTEKEKVTLRRLITHSAGLTVWGFPGYEVGKPVPTVPQLLDGTPPANTPAVRNDTTPGAFWRYSGGGMTIAQLASTDVSGEPFPVMMQRLVLGPAKMVHSTYENPPPARVARLAASGHEKTDVPVPGRFHVYPEMAAAGLWTTSADLGRWAIAVARAYLGDKNGVISPEMAKQMLTRQIELKPPYAQPGTAWFGLGVALEGLGDTLRFSHNGRDEGFVAELTMWPAKGRGLVIMASGVNAGLFAEIRRAYDEMYGTHTAPPRTDLKTIAVAAASLDAYAGRFLLAAQGADSNILVIRRDGSRLYARNTVTKVERLLHASATDEFTDLETGSKWVFRRDNGTKVNALMRGTGTNMATAPKLP